ncbi:unnamed protein product [Lepeophtheirus salmonis]|uniref:(salmon louse) hypothetical protein n=1 Tax=Lepeophtheirus salmonis TaxID=72036 RepID=A0A7R8CBN8_LEPSM|nr:unnamed protein product [Lepeophtheirus salmonis]CAF2762584.1 unnamed protein product [Lepeophtheirus salmonis]
MTSVSKDFEEYLSYMENEMNIREQIRQRVRELDQISREITAILEKIHQLGHSDDAAVTHYLMKESLMTRDEASAKLGVDSCSKNESKHFHLDLEDYFGGVIQMSNELARFTITSVTRRDYKRPILIATFLNELKRWISTFESQK